MRQAVDTATSTHVALQRARTHISHRETRLCLAVCSVGARRAEREQSYSYSGRPRVGSLLSWRSRSIQMPRLFFLPPQRPDSPRPHVAAAGLARTDEAGAEAARLRLQWQLQLQAALTATRLRLCHLQRAHRPRHGHDQQQPPPWRV